MAKRAGYIPVVLDTAKIHALRTAAGLSMEAAAVKAGKAGKQWWAKIESAAKPPNIELDTLNLIAKVLGVSAKELLK